MKHRLMLTGVLLAVSASTAMAAGPYVGASGGVSIFHDQDIRYSSGSTSTAEFKTGYGFNASAGYNFDPVRVEFEFGYKQADVDNFSSGSGLTPGSGSDATFISYMANAYYDFKNSSQITPYVGAGIGALNGEFRDPDFKSDDTVFGYQLIAGVAYNVTQNVALDLSYRFQSAASDFKIATGTEVSYMSSNVVAGLRVNF